MMLALVAAVLLTAPEPTLSLGSIRSLSPRAFGNVVLRGRNLGIVEKVETQANHALEPPGSVTLELTERPKVIANGCVRQMWSARFQRALGDAESAAVFQHAYATTQVALRSASTCLSGSYAHLNPGLSIEEALSALRFLQEVRSGKAKVQFTCTDTTGSSLCRTPQGIRRELTKLPAFIVMRSGGRTEVVLGKPGQAVTVVSYSETSRDRVRVERRVPAPA